MPIIVFNLLTEGNIARAVAGERIGTLVSTPAPHTSDAPSPRGAAVIDETLFDAEEKMEKAVARGQGRPGHACAPAGPTRTCSPGSSSTTTARSTPLTQLAIINIPEARMAVIKPYDASQLQAIEKAIRDSDLGVNPSNDGSIIRVVIPAADRGAPPRDGARSPAARARTPRSPSATSAARRRTSWTRSSQGRRGGRGRGRAAPRRNSRRHRPLRRTRSTTWSSTRKPSCSRSDPDREAHPRAATRSPEKRAAAGDRLPRRPRAGPAGSRPPPRRGAARPPGVRRAPAATSARRSPSGSASARSSSCRC